MLRSLVFALSLVVSIAPAVARADAPVAAESAKFPLPADAEAPQATKGGGGAIKTYNVPRGRTVVTEEARAALAKGKWEIVKDEPSPSGNATRIQAKHGGKLWKASFTGDDKRTVIIVTVP